MSGKVKKSRRQITHEGFSLDMGQFIMITLLPLGILANRDWLTHVLPGLLTCVASMLHEGLAAKLVSMAHAHNALKEIFSILKAVQMIEQWPTVDRAENQGSNPPMDYSFVVFLLSSGGRFNIYQIQDMSVLFP